MSEFNKITPLKIIEVEIQRLSQLQDSTGLSLEDVKKLETLIKTRQLILGEPTTITQSISNKEITDDQVLSALTLTPLMNEAKVGKGKK